MKFLLDTHALLWYLSGDENLSERCKDLIERKRNQAYLSVASIWEIAIKLNLNKLKLHQPFSQIEQGLRRFDIVTLPITFADALAYSSLPLHHRDPFDRMILSQAIANRLPIVSRDVNFDRYAVERIWE